MNLQEHMDILGWSVADLSRESKITQPVIKRVLTGLPITKKHAIKICSTIGTEFGHRSSSRLLNGVDYNIDGIETVGE